jgi:hypothetical protein
MKRSCKILPGSPLRPTPLLTRGNENLRSGQRTKEGTRLGRASLIKAQKYIFELGEAADKEEKKRSNADRDEERRRREGTGSSILPLADIYSVNRQTDGQTMMLIARWTKASIA